MFLCVTTIKISKICLFLLRESLSLLFGTLSDIGKNCVVQLMLFFDNYCSVSELLEKHGLQKPVSFVKDTKNSPEEARKLMIRLTRHTARK